MPVARIRIPDGPMYHDLCDTSSKSSRSLNYICDTVPEFRSSLPTYFTPKHLLNSSARAMTSDSGLMGTGADDPTSLKSHGQMNRWTDGQTLVLLHILEY